MKNGSLVVVGTGIKFLSHLSYEAKIHIEQSDKVLYLVNDPIMKEWIQKTNVNSESLDAIYFQHQFRSESYRAITEYILCLLRQQIHLCVVFYGHPSVFADSPKAAVIQAKKEGYHAKILPAISAEDCLFADLLIDPGSSGCQSFEATDFLFNQRKFDSSAHLILWQVDVIGVLDNPINHDNAKAATVLVNYLHPAYPLEHEIFLYEAAQYPSFEPIIQNCRLRDLPQISFSPISLLYIPPLARAS